jgi:peptidoglycan hydrolase CwlO-like protein
MGGGLFRNLMTNQIRYFTSIKMSDDEINELNKSWSNPEETVESVDSNVNSTVTTPQARSTSKVEGRKVEESALSKELASLRESVAQLTSDNKDLRSKLSASETSGLGNETIVPEAISQPADITGQIEFVRSRRD